MLCIYICHCSNFLPFICQIWWELIDKLSSPHVWLLDYYDVTCCPVIRLYLSCIVIGACSGKFFTLWSIFWNGCNKDRKINYDWSSEIIKNNFLKVIDSTVLEAVINSSQFLTTVLVLVIFFNNHGYFTSRTH